MNVSAELHRLLDRSLDDHPRVALSAARKLAADVDGWVTDRAALNARRSGKTWAEIGRLLGVSRQAARTRFTHLDGHVSATAPIGDLSGPERKPSEAEAGNRHVRGYLADQRRRNDLIDWECSGVGIVPW